jgi:hypothetical protein
MIFIVILSFILDYKAYLLIILLILILLIRFCCLVLSKPLVNPSASCSLVGIYPTFSLLLLIHSLIKWYIISICLVLLWNSGFSASFKDPWLSTNIIGVVLLVPKLNLVLINVITLFKYIFSF